MGSDALVVSLVLGILFLAATTYNNRKHRQYKESVSEALTRGDVAKEALEQLKIEMAGRPERVAGRQFCRLERVTDVFCLIVTAFYDFSVDKPALLS